MSAYVVDRHHYAAIARLLHSICEPRGLYVYHPDAQALGGDYFLTPDEVANVLLTCNVASVAARYSEDPVKVKPIRTGDWFGKPVPRAIDMLGPLRSIRYQSCEVDGYTKSLAHAALHECLWAFSRKAAEEAGAPTWA